MYFQGANNGSEREGDVGMNGKLQTVAVIGGTGAEGSGIALRLAHAGHRVIIGTRDPAKGAKTAAELNGVLGTSALEWQDNKSAAGAAEIVVLTVPYSAQVATVVGMRDALRGKILVDATVPLVPPKVSRVQLPVGGSAVAMVQAMLGDTVRVVSAFQNVSAHKLCELGTDVDCDVLVCADDAEARQIVIDLVARIGLRGIDAGPICNSVAAEALTSILIAINRQYKVPGSGIRITGMGSHASGQ
jgi:8-hydroxy-5-deazaflavin:NADPH oxidoreductase